MKNARNDALREFYLADDEAKPSQNSEGFAPWTVASDGCVEVSITMPGKLKKEQIVSLIQATEHKAISKARGKGAPSKKQLREKIEKYIAAGDTLAAIARKITAEAGCAYTVHNVRELRRYNLKTK